MGWCSRSAKNHRHDQERKEMSLVVSTISGNWLICHDIVLFSFSTYLETYLQEDSSGLIMASEGATAFLPILLVIADAATLPLAMAQVELWFEPCLWLETAWMDLPSMTRYLDLDNLLHRNVVLLCVRQGHLEKIQNIQNNDWSHQLWQWVIAPCICLSSMCSKNVQEMFRDVMRLPVELL